MANITKRGDTFRIKISCGYDAKGKQVVKSMTFKPTQGMSDKQIEKEVNRQAVLFEESCKQGQSVTAMKFENFAREWIKDYAEIKLKKLTLRNYHSMKKRIYNEIGHLRIDKISPIDIQKLVTRLTNEGLCSDNVKNHVRFVSGILNYAVKKRILLYNPCTTVDFPESEKKEKEYYTVEEVKRLLTLLQDEDDDKKPFAVFFTLAAFTGARNGELLGLEWKDIDFEHSTVAIKRASYYSSLHKEIFTDKPKSKSSVRGLKLPDHVINILKKYKAWQDQQREICCGSWVETDRLFTKWNGEAMRPNAPLDFLKRFCKRNGFTKNATVHSFRHFNASALIDAGVDVVKVQTALGHSTPAITLRAYSHAFSNAQARTMEAIANAINL
jgi:integrase